MRIKKKQTWCLVDSRNKNDALLKICTLFGPVSNDDLLQGDDQIQADLLGTSGLY